MTLCRDARARVRASGSRPPSYNDMVVKACALALREHPLGNASWTDAGFELYSRVNVGIAVASEGVLMVPTIRDADRKGLTGIAAESARLAEGVRSGTIAPTMRATLGCDHRVLYGADAAALLARVRQLLEEPLGLAG